MVSTRRLVYGAAQLEGFQTYGTFVVDVVPYNRRDAFLHDRLLVRLVRESTRFRHTRFFIQNVMDIFDRRS